MRERCSIPCATSMSVAMNQKTRRSQTKSIPSQKATVTRVLPLAFYMLLTKPHLHHTSTSIEPKRDEAKNVASATILPTPPANNTHVIQRRHSMAWSSLPDCSAEAFSRNSGPRQQSSVTDTSGRKPPPSSSWARAAGWGKGGAGSGRGFVDGSRYSWYWQYF